METHDPPHPTIWGARDPQPPELMPMICIPSLNIIHNEEEQFLTMALRGSKHRFEVSLTSFFLSLPRERGRPALSLAVSPSHRQHTITVLIKAELA